MLKYPHHTIQEKTGDKNTHIKGASKLSSDIYDLLWVEKYRPKSLKDIVNQKEIVARLQKFVAEKNMPHLLFAGPPGTGKCVTYDTPVLTPSGPRKIGEIVERYVKTGSGEVFEKAEIPVYSLGKNGTIIEAKASHVYKGKASSIAVIELGSGRKLEVTLRHPLLVMDGEGRISWKLPKDIRVGDKIGVPRNISFPEYPSDETEVFLSELLGYILADGNIYLGKGSSHHNAYVAFHNHNEHLRQRVKWLFKKVYGVDAKEEFPKNKTPWVRVNRKNIVIDIADKAGIHGRKARKVRIPSIAWKSKKTLSAFIKAFIDSDGSIGKNELSIVTASKDMAIDLLYAFNILGVIARLKEKKKKNWTYYRVIVSGSDQLSKLVKEVKLSHPAKKAKLEQIVRGEDKWNTNVDTVYIPVVLKDTLVKLGDLVAGSLSRREKKLLLEKKSMSMKAFRQLAGKIMPKLINVIDDIEEKLVLLEKPFDLDSKALVSKLDPYKVPSRRRHRIHEYVSGKRTPRLQTVSRLMGEDSIVESVIAYREILREVVSKYLSYNEIGRKIGSYGSSLKILLESNIRVERLSEIEKVRETVYSELKGLYSQVAEAVYYTSSILRLDLFWDDVRSIRMIEKETTVYDLTVPSLENFVGGYGPVVLHNTTAAHALARDLYGDDYRSYFLELNASDERGIDVIRSKVKEFARSRTPPGVPFRIVLLDEADNMTSDAQQALRRLMELYTVSTRFILIANYPSKIIDPIQSRCALFRFTPLSKEDVVSRLAYILENEGVDYDEEALESIYEISEGDMRKAINILQAAASLGKVTVSMVYKVVGLAHPVEVREMIETALKGDFDTARAKLRKLMVDYGLAGTDLLKQVHRELFGNKIQIPEEYRVLIADYLGEMHFRVVEGSDDDIQLTAFLAWLSMLGKKLGE